MRFATLCAVVLGVLLGFSFVIHADQAPASRPATTSRPASRPASTQPSDKRLIIETSLGRIVVELTPDKTPITAKNFVRYADEKFYDGTIFHRTMKGFMIQGGGFTPELKEKETHSPIKNESQQAISNSRGTIAMARRPARDSATAQFFINLEDRNKFLDYPNNGGYAAFGRVVEGMDVVDKIADVPVKQGISEAQPIEPVIIKSIRRAPAE